VCGGGELRACPIRDTREIVRQYRAAVAWIHAHAGECSGEGMRIHVGGSSAGGDLAAMILTPPGRLISARLTISLLARRC
jgi:acetyl esterase/lipase